MNVINFIIKVMFRLLMTAVLIGCMLLVLSIPTVQHHLINYFLKQDQPDIPENNIGGNLFTSGLQIKKIATTTPYVTAHLYDTNISVFWGKHSLIPQLNIASQKVDVYPIYQLNQNAKSSTNWGHSRPLALNQLTIKKMTLHEPWSTRHIDIHHIDINAQHRSLEASFRLYNHTIKSKLHLTPNGQISSATINDNQHTLTLNSSNKDGLYTLFSPKHHFEWQRNGDDWHLKLDTNIPGLSFNSDNSLRVSASLHGNAYEAYPDSFLKISGLWRHQPLLGHICWSAKKQMNGVFKYGKNTAKIDHTPQISKLLIELNQLHLIHPELHGDLHGIVHYTDTWYSQLSSKKLQTFGLKMLNATVTLTPTANNHDYNYSFNAQDFSWQRLIYHNMHISKKDPQKIDVTWKDSEQQQQTLHIINKPGEILFLPAKHEVLGWKTSNDISLKNKKGNWTLSPTCIQHNTDRICLNGHINFNTLSWHINLDTKIAQLDIDTAPWFDSLTGFDLNLFHISGNAALSGEKFTLTDSKGRISAKNIKGHALNIVPQFYLPTDYLFDEGFLTLDFKKDQIHIKGQTNAQQGLIHIDGTYKQDQLSLQFNTNRLTFGYHPKNNLTAKVKLNIDYTDHINITGTANVLEGYLKPDSLATIPTLTDDVHIQTEHQTNIPLFVNFDLNIPPQVTIEYFGLYGKMRGQLTISDNPEMGARVNGKLDLEDSYFGIFGRDVKLKYASITYYNAPWEDPILDFSAQQHVTGQTLANGFIHLYGTPDNLNIKMYSIPPGVSDIEILTNLFSKSQLPVYRTNDPTLISLMNQSHSQRALAKLLTLLDQIEKSFYIDEISVDTNKRNIESDEIIPTSLTIGKRLGKYLAVKYRLQIRREEENQTILSYRITPNLTAELSTSIDNTALFLMWSSSQ